MRGQSLIITVSNSVNELKILTGHLDDKQLVDLGAHIREMSKSITNDRKDGLMDIIDGRIKTRLQPPQLRALLDGPVEFIGGMHKAVLSGYERETFDVKAFKVSHPVLYAQFCTRPMVATLSYKPRG